MGRYTAHVVGEAQFQDVIAEIAEGKRARLVKLVPEPDNLEDPRAIKAITLDGRKVGNLERDKYGDARNLYLHVTKTGSKSWLFIYRRLGRDRMRGLGSYRNVSLEEAREKAADFRALLRQGIEPPVSRGAVQKKEEHRTFAQPGQGRKPLAQ